MLPVDVDTELARLCLSSETDAQGFDFIDDGAESGVWFGVKKWETHDVVCFRGSITRQDWQLDLNTEMIAVPGLGLVHSGFIKNMALVRAHLDTLVRPNPIVTGHSLGAARAALYSGMLVQGRNDDPIYVALYGCPRPGGPDLRTLLKNVSIVSYKNMSDPVTDVPLPLPDLPYTHVRDFTAVSGLVDYSLGPPWNEHHIVNYIEGIKNAKLKASQ